MEQIFILSLFLGIALCIAFTVIITFRNYFASDKFIKIKLENFRQDVENLNIENRRLRGAVNRSKREPDLPDSIDDGNIADVAMSLLPKKYHKIAYEGQLLEYFPIAESIKRNKPIGKILCDLNYLNH